MKMENRNGAQPPSAENTAGTWIMLGILLVLAVGIGIGSLALTSFTSQQQLATGSQTVPSSR
jgi:hypothetical protein